MALIAVLAGIPAVQQLYDWHNEWTTPIEWKDVKVLTPVIRAGDELSLQYTAKVNRTCPADLRGFLIYEDGSSPVRFPVVTGGYRKPTDDFISFNVHISIPKTADVGLGNLLPGKYVYRSLVTRYCPEGQVEDAGVPDAKFEIVN